MKAIKELLGPIIRPMEELAERLNRTEYEIGNIPVWLVGREYDGQLSKITEEQFELIFWFALQAERLGGRLPISLDEVGKTGWLAERTIRKHWHVRVAYEYALRHPRFVEFSGPSEDGRDNIVSVIFAKDPAEFEYMLSSADPEASQLKYFPTTHMLTGISQKGNQNEVYRMIESPYAPRGHEPMSVWIRTDTV